MVILAEEGGRGDVGRCENLTEGERKEGVKRGK